MELSVARRTRWSVASVASLGAHGALVTGALLWSLHRPPIAAGGADQLTEFEVRAPALAVSTPQPAPQPGPAVPGPRARRARGVRPSPAATPPVWYEDSDFGAPAAGHHDGDDDWTDDSDAPATPGGGGSASGTAAVPAQILEKPITPLEAAYLCTYQSLRGLPPSLYRRGHSYKMVVQMCISSEGRVDSVTLQKGAAPELDSRVVTDMHAWRYKPRIVKGKRSAFCYKVNVTYEVD